MHNRQIWYAVRPEAVQKTRQILKTSSAYDSTKKIVKLDDAVSALFVCISHEDGIAPTYSCALPTLTRLEVEKPVSQYDGLLPVGNERLARIRELARASDMAVLMLKVEDEIDASSEQGIFKPSNPFAVTLRKWLSSLPQDVQAQLPRSIRNMMDLESCSYQVYPPLLLLGPSTFASPEWHDLLHRAPRGQPLHDLMDALCASMGVTHIAINKPIPAILPPPTGTSINTLTPAATDTLPTAHDTRENILRAPLALQPLHGDFGSPTAPATPAFFSTALWATARQNGLTQVFAPMHTMFSGGNIKEKARVLEFPGLRDATAPCTVVDLYAGIGYFAFSYVKAGARAVLGWEINGWSVEGARRGAERNGWRMEIVRGGDSSSGGGCGNGEDIVNGWLLEFRRFGERGEGKRSGGKKPRLLMFEESNENAARRVERLRHGVPPVRHVNCGYLPTSKGSWGVAVRCMDPKLGGWVHAHENVREGDIAMRKGEIERDFAKLAEGKFEQGAKVACEHVEKVKSYAPGVIHCVFDIHIQPNEVS
ncbi:MAG: hypothetical protein LQ340_000212 [Diploschistes diacapsis]|nr:MAG: hypothetical protein LQ340_000212 [Diploschistes diacapsis]